MGDVNLEAWTFIAGPNAVGKSFIIDMQEQRTPARLRFYGMLPFKNFPHVAINHVIVNKMPNEITVYGSNDKTNWSQIGYFWQDRNSVDQGSWVDLCSITASVNEKLTTLAQVKASNPCFMTIEFLKDTTPYRYLKLTVNNVFRNPNLDINPIADANANNYVTFNELEVLVKK